MANFSSNYITDRDIMKLPFNKTRREYHWNKWPWMLVLPDITGRGDIKYYNLQGTKGFAGTTLTAAWAGGAATGTFTVADSSIFKATEKFVFCADASNAAQMVRITAIPDATHVTVSSLDGATLITAKANGTVLSKAGTHQDYETYHRTATRLPTREYNVYEPILVRQEYGINVVHSDLQDDSEVYSDQVADVVSQWKQSATNLSIKGEMVDPTTSTNGEAAMAGLDQILAGVGGTSYITTLPLVTASDKENLRKAVMDIADQGGFPDAAVEGAQVCLANTAMVRFWMGLDDDKDGISAKETDKRFKYFTIGGIDFRLVHDHAMTEIYGADKPTAFFLTMRENGKSLLNWVWIKDPKMAGNAVKVDQPSTIKVAVECGQVATLDMKDQWKSMFFRSTTALS